MGVSASSYDRIYAIVRQIPQGKIATYGQIAELSGLVGKARVVGYALYRVDPQTSDIPWHRVVNAKGEISESPFRNGGDYLQRSLLEQEGIKFSLNKINLRDYRWYPDQYSSV
ncbi:putative methylated DNA-protein cysteine methyltransferase [Synechococcus sp. PCC 7502]|uniref:MGMT family protein n=1 Tax=Synechococcus sp. PCC 7502 TaxID=1173263 RepID=UPI00029F9C4C|nr:MGMT family protein [Synechococcus sp. PCC 7502]AFY72814.1 putative methylated DNA-protein cysteine methyltransferase [Synechococcus sp. PCC 7502]